MPLPEFTNDEQYVLSFIKSPKMVGASSAYMWGYILGGIIIAGFGAYFSNVLMMAAAFVVVCGFRIYEERYQLKSIPLWRSIIEKYEAAAVSNDSAPTDNLDRKS